MTKAEIVPRIEKDRAEQARLSAELVSAEQDTNVIDLHPQAVVRFRDNLEAIAAAINGPGNEVGDELSSRFRELIETVVVMPRKAYEPYQLELMGRLSGLLGGPVWPRGSVVYSDGAGCRI